MIACKNIYVPEPKYYGYENNVQDSVAGVAVSGKAEVYGS
jgi:hypothetical protein